MTILKHELKRNRTSWLIWAGAIGALLVTCIFLFPEMKDQMAGVGEMFSSMGAFTTAFGMDRLNFGTLTGYYAIECGNVLGLGGAFYAALTGAGMLAKEENGRTGEFLLTHPVSRRRVVAEKLLALAVLITALNLVIYGLAAGSMLAIGEPVPWKELNLLHAAYFLMQLELGAVCFGISAFLRRGSAGVGLGVAFLMYFLNLIANITDSVKFLKYITPFGYCDGAEVVSSGKLDGAMLAVGAGLAVLGILAAFWQYERKDIH
ncbi:MAG: ABC transporter permease subunit [Lachnospiraceae bacterium]|nr:ABC transporter permease subunit [Lachnospiraceae bacterium]